MKGLAGIEYHGRGGITQDCLNAIVSIIHFGHRIDSAKLLTHRGRHCFLLTINEFDLVAIKSGFSSGYPGEGPRGLSSAIKLLHRHNVEIYEYSVSDQVIDRVDSSCLLESDIKDLESKRPVLPHRYHDYIIRNPDAPWPNDGHLKQLFPTTLPFGLLDLRLIDLALEFDENSDSAILTGFRRLEDIVRDRAAIQEHGVNVFSKAFQGDTPILAWEDIGAAEAKGRASLFTGTFMAFRNPRAHKELAGNKEKAYREFLLLNELYLLESESCIRQTP